MRLFQRANTFRLADTFARNSHTQIDELQSDASYDASVTKAAGSALVAPRSEAPSSSFVSPNAATASASATTAAAAVVALALQLLPLLKPAAARRARASSPRLLVAHPSHLLLLARHTLKSRRGALHLALTLQLRLSVQPRRLSKTYRPSSTASRRLKEPRVQPAAPHLQKSLPSLPTCLLLTSAYMRNSHRDSQPVVTSLLVSFSSLFFVALYPYLAVTSPHAQAPSSSPRTQHKTHSHTQLISQTFRTLHIHVPFMNNLQTISYLLALVWPLVRSSSASRPPPPLRLTCTERQIDLSRTLQHMYERLFLLQLEL